MTAVTTIAHVADRAVSAPARARIRHLHAFRGFAIISVVLVHAFHNQFAYAGIEPNADNGVFGAVVNTLFHDATLYFTLISGLLFSMLLKRRGWMQFYRSKLLYVLVPYAFMTVVFTAYGLQEGGALNGFHGDFVHYLKMSFWNFRNGSALYPYWYILVLAVIFAITPLLAWLMDNARTRWVMWALAIVPLVMSRFITDFTPTTILYFVGAYAAGMLIGDRYESAMALFARRRWLIAAIAVISSAVLIYLHVAGIDRVGIVSLRETAFYVQKIAVSAVVLVMFRAAEDYLPAWLETLATYSFTVYFIHAFMLTEFELTILRLPVPLEITVLQQVAIALVSAAFAILASIAVGMIARRILGARSRMVFGS